VYAANTSFLQVPSVLIYPKKKMKESFPYGAPTGTVFRCQDKSWMDSEVFCEWKRHFFSDVKLIPQENMLLISDGHSSLSLSLATTEIPRKHGVRRAVAAFSQHAHDAASRCNLRTGMAPAIAKKLRETCRQNMLRRW
jgi:hypothetical protein